MKVSTRLLVTVLASALALPAVSFAAKGDAKKNGKAPAGFAAIDKDSDGNLTEAEFVAAMEGRGNDTAAKKRFSALDKDNNGKVSKDEFEAGRAGGEKKKGNKKKNQE